MNVKLCNNQSEANIINKRITELAERTCIIKGDLSVETPVILLQYDSTNMPKVNYMKISDLNRCYYVTEVIDLTGGRYEIRGKVDVLESFKDQILGLSVIIDKQAQITPVNRYIDDGSYVVENKEYNTVLNFPTGFNDAGEYILITAGGGGGVI